MKLKKKPLRRGKGRPVGVGEKTVGRDALIAATIELLRSHPPATLNLIDVARFAGVDPALIRYYFGDRDGLFTAAALAMLDEFQLKLDAHDASPWTAEEWMRDRVRVIMEQYLQHPNFHEVVVNQIIRGDPHTGKKALQALADRSAAGVQSIMAQGAKTKELRPLDARFLQIALVGACGFFVTAKPLVEALFRGQKVTTDTAEAYGNFVADLILEGLKTSTKDRKPSPAKPRSRRASALN